MSICLFKWLADSFRARIARAMKRAMNNRGLASDVLHYVDFTALGPAFFFNIFPEYPESRPNTLTSRNGDPCFKPAVSLGELSPSYDSGRCILTGPVPARPSFFRLLEGFYNQAPFPIQVTVLHAFSV